MFKLDERLAQDSFVIADLKICRVLLMNNKNYPWLILVPCKPDLIELIDLSFETQIEVLNEINLMAKILQKKFNPHKINIGALGNIVRQLHIHIIARFENDNSFPRPAWGEAVELYKKEDAKKIISEIQAEIQESLMTKEVLAKQVLYRSVHRGCKETDFLIGEFAKEKIALFDEKKLHLFKKFIEEDDLLIYDWIIAKQDFSMLYKDLILEIREFHNMV